MATIHQYTISPFHHPTIPQVLRSQDSGFMSTRVKPRHYLQDPQLFNSSRPAKPNPF